MVGVSGGRCACWLPGQRQRHDRPMSVHVLSLLVDVAPARRAVGQVACFNASAMTAAVRCGASSGMRNTAPGIVTRVTLGAAGRRWPRRGRACPVQSCLRPRCATWRLSWPLCGWVKIRAGRWPGPPSWCDDGSGRITRWPGRTNGRDPWPTPSWPPRRLPRRDRHRAHALL